jgi:YidC/Oxa1 family membrane protein insertase
MERRTIFAILLIFVVLVGAQVLQGMYVREKRRQMPPPAAQSAPGTSDAGGATAIGAAPGAAGTAAGPAGTTGAAPPAPAPGSGAPGAAAPSSALRAGAAPTSLRSVPAPRLERSLDGEDFTITFTSEGGSVAHWVLSRYRDPVRRAPTVDLVPEGARAVQVVVRTGFGEYDFSDAPFALLQYDPAAGRIAFAAQDSSGVRVEKHFRLSGDRRLLELDLRVSAPPELGAITYRLGWVAPLPITEPQGYIQDHKGVAYLGQKLVSAPTMPRGKQKSDQRVETGNVRWVGQRSRYFVAAVLPDSDSVNDAVIEYRGWTPPVSPELQLPGRDLVAASAWLSGGAPPGTVISRHTRIYAGPIRYESLQSLGVGLEALANLGWKWLVPLSVLLLKLLNLLYKAIPNYGVAIIVLSAATKLVFYPLTHSSLRTMKVMHRLQPLVEEIRKKHKDDPAKMNQVMMKLYKDNKVNPLGGCLPMLLQIPVFFALYNVLLFSIELRAAPFLGYIQDLSAPDVLARMGAFNLHLMPIVMTASSYLLQWQTPVDPRQKVTMYLMPLMMLIFMYTFPSGVIIYWTVNNVLSALQQFLVNRAEDRRVSVEAS